VGKKPCEKRRKTRSFQCEKERKSCTFFNRTLRSRYIKSLVCKMPNRSKLSAPSWISLFSRIPLFTDIFIRNFFSRYLQTLWLGLLRFIFLSSLKWKKSNFSVSSWHPPNVERKRERRTGWWCLWEFPQRNLLLLRCHKIHENWADVSII
jgi:hypothetical protein